MPKKTKSSACTEPAKGRRSARKAGPSTPGQEEPLVLSPPATGEPLVLSQPKAGEVRSHRELAEAIFSECDPVKVGRELLQSGSEKGASVRARVFETLANWQFGKAPDSSAGQTRVRVIWSIPRPPRESEEPK